jgi:Skp family chaperone for outer membrane proteins
MATKKQDPEQTPPPPDNVDQIREILFGNQIRAVDERFQAVEKRMAKEGENLRKTLEKRIHDLENLLDKFRDNAGDQLNRESAERDAGINEVSKSLANFRLDAENQLAEMQSDFNSEIKRVRKEMLAAQETLMGGLASLETAQTERSDLLDKSKVDRGELAGFLTGIAEQLSPPAQKRSK